MLLLCALIAGTSSSWAEDITYIFTNASWNATVGGTAANWTSGKAGGGFNNNGVQVTTAYTGANATSPRSFNQISQVVVTYNTNKSAGAGSISIQVGSNTAKENNVEYSGSGDGRSANYTTTFTYTTPETGNVKITANTTTNSLYIVSVKITYAPAAETQVQTPAFSKGTGEYTGTQSVSLSCATSGATIHYTTDGTTPTASSKTYSEEISVTTNGTTIKAIAVKEGLTDSEVASATYTIFSTTPSISVADNVVTISVYGGGSTIYYTTDGTTPTNASAEYSAPFSVTESCTIKAIGYDNTYGNASKVKEYTYTYMPLLPKNINSGYFVKVTDVSELENGDAILIVNEEEGYALGPQSGNNCPAKSVEFSNGAISNIGDAQKLVLVIYNEGYYFYVGDQKYLVSSTGTNNYLKTTTSINDNAKATISINEGDATIVFQGDGERKHLRFNLNEQNNNPLFSCYQSSATFPLVQIYKEVPVEVTLAASGYASYCSPLPLDLTPTDNYAAYVVTQVNKEAPTVMFEKITGAVPAGTPFILYGKEAANTTVTLPVATGATTAPENNMLIGTLEPTPINTVEGIFTNFGLSGGSFVKLNNGTIPANKAYLPVLTSLVSDAPALTIVFGDDETTGISLTPNPSLKGEGSIYTLDGRRVENPTKGIYIVNGKKVIIK